MRLVFIHGWAFDAGIWREVLPLLDGFTCVQAELGFLGAPRALPALQPDDVLIGHSLGFMWGIDHHAGWPRWIAINGFARFCETCAPEKILSAMARNLKRDAHETVAAFYATIGHAPQPENLYEPTLAEGLDWLKKLDVESALCTGTGRGLVLAGQHDPIVPGDASQRLADCRNGTDILWHNKGGHLLPWQAPDWCAAAIRKFLA